MNARGGDIASFPIRARELGSFVRAVQAGELPREAAKSDVFPAMAATGRPWQEIAKEKGIVAVQGDALLDACRAALAEHPDVVARFKSGKVGIKGVLVGDVMKRTRGSADAKRVAQVIDELLASA
ncbi:MAG: hypothetical protein K8T90_09595 [Planctomycetes bacterium]|nr:hypothetical protein [Planctomycetota bacterium]